MNTPRHSILVDLRDGLAKSLEGAIDSAEMWEEYADEARAEATAFAEQLAEIEALLAAEVIDI